MHSLDMNSTPDLPLQLHDGVEAAAIQVQETISDRLAAWTIAGPILFALSIGTQFMMTAILTYGPISMAKDNRIYTDQGVISVWPERDIPLYAAGIILCLGLMVTAGVIWERVLRRKSDAIRREFALKSSIYLIFLAGFSLLLYLLVASYRFKYLPINFPPKTDQIASLFPAAAALICCMFYFGGFTLPVLTQRQWRLIDLVNCIVITCLLYIPASNWDAMAGGDLSADRMHHWNYFSMSPALAYAHGGAFETDFYCQYGIGWPFLFASIRSVVPLTYGHMVGISTLFACVYFLAMYYLLRQLLGSRAWAFSAVILGITWQLCTGRLPVNDIWQTPSSTMMRDPFDICFFIAVLLHQRTRTRKWLAVLGLICGLSLFFETETGGYLFITFAFYFLLDMVAGEDRSSFRKRTIDLAISATAAVLVLAPLLWFASRGTMFQRGFWSHALAGINMSVSGVGMVPLRSVDDTSRVFFVVFVVIYLGTIGITCAKAFYRTAGSQSILLATVAVYGLGLLLLFVGRSLQPNLYHPSLPLAILLIAFLAISAHKLRPWFEDTSFPTVVSLTLLALLISSAEYLGMPTLVCQALGKQPPTGVLLIKDPPDLAYPDTIKFNPEELKGIAARMHELAAGGNKIVAVDSDDTLLYYMSGIGPPLRTSSLFAPLFTKAELEDACDEVMRVNPKYYVIRDVRDAGVIGDVGMRFRQLVESHCVLAETVGKFEIWVPRQTAAK